MIRKHFKPSALILVLILVGMMTIPGFAATDAKTITVDYGIKLIVNGKEFVGTDVNGKVVAPYTFEGTTFVPIRAAANALGADVEYDAATDTAYVYSHEIAALVLDPVEKDGDFAAFLALLNKITNVNLASFAGLTATADNVAAAANAAADIAEVATAFEKRGDKNASITAATAAELLPAGFGGTFTAEELNETAFRVASYTGLTRGYVGRISDDDIMAKLDSVWSSIPEVLNEELKAMGGALLDEGLITGFNIRSKYYSFNFDPDLTLFYGHSSLKHAKQLVLVLKANDIDARIAFEPKTSWYIWEGLNYDQEYDLLIEFAGAADKAEFDSIARDYAQKYRDAANDDKISGSWFAPLYGAFVPISDGYTEVVNNTATIEGSNYYITTYGLKGESSAPVLAGFEAAGAKASQTPLYVNDTFYDYLVENLPETVENAA